MLMPTENFPQQASSPRTRDRIADFARSDNTKAGSSLPRFCVRSPPIQYQATFDDALAFAARAVEFPAPLQPLGLRKPERLARWSLARHESNRIKPGSNVCGQHGGDLREPRDRSCWNCD
jgi:hypothetical protein